MASNYIPDNIDAVLCISSVVELRAYLELYTINWGQLSKYKKKDSDFPLFELLEKIDGETLGERAYRLLYPAPSCRTCQSKSAIFYNWQRGYSQYCGKKCMAGDADLNQRTTAARTSTMLERYGVATSLQSRELKKKIESTNIEKYGHALPIMNSDVHARQQSTLLARYGVCVPSKNKDIAIKSGDAKRKSTWDNRILSLRDSVEYIDERSFNNREDRSWKCVKCSNIFTHNWDATQRNPICRNCTPMIKGSSIFEQEIYDFICANYGMTVERNKRFYYGSRYFELDIFIPELNFGVEFNGLYWHSELSGKDRNYHKVKKEFFNELNIRSAFIFEHEWINNSAICKSMILHKLGISTASIYARSCSIISPDKSNVVEFLKSNHISGYADHSIAYALSYNGELVALATFKVDRFGQDKSIYELIRFCTRAGYSVPGALSKLINKFQRDHKKMVKTFCDLRWGDGQSYIKSGFKRVKITSPCCWYFDKHNVVYHRSIFQKKKLLSILDLEDSSETEWQLAQRLNLNRFWDCGSIVLHKEA